MSERADRIAAYRKAATLHRSAAEQFDMAAGFAAADNATVEADAYARAAELAQFALDAVDELPPRAARSEAATQ